MCYNGLSKPQIRATLWIVGNIVRMVTEHSSERKHRKTGCIATDRDVVAGKV